MSVTADLRASPSFQNVLRGDFFGGVAAGVVALPLALGCSAGVPASYGGDAQ